MYGSLFHVNFSRLFTTRARFVLAVLLFVIYQCVDAASYTETYSFSSGRHYTRSTTISIIYLPPPDMEEARICMQSYESKYTLSTNPYLAGEDADEYSYATSLPEQQAGVSFHYQLLTSRHVLCSKRTTEHITTPLTQPGSTYITYSTSSLMQATDTGTEPINGLPSDITDRYAIDMGAASYGDDYPDQNKQEAHNEPAPGPNIGFEYWHNFYDSDVIYDGRFYSMYLEAYKGNNMESGGGRIVYGTYSVSPSTDAPNNLISSANSLSLDIFIKDYTDDFLFIVSPYALFSIGYGIMTYNFKQPVIDYYGNPITYDTLRYLEFRAGIGGELFRYGYMQISVYGGADTRIYLWSDTSDFYNKLFDNTIAFTWGASLGLRF